MAFQVGDKVKIAPGANIAHRVGDVGEITHIATVEGGRVFPYTVKIGSDTEVYSELEIERVGAEIRELLSDLSAAHIALHELKSASLEEWLAGVRKVVAAEDAIARLVGE